MRKKNCILVIINFHLYFRNFHTSKLYCDSIKTTHIDCIHSWGPLKLSCYKFDFCFSLSSTEISVYQFLFIYIYCLTHKNRHHSQQITIKNLKKNIIKLCGSLKSIYHWVKMAYPSGNF